MPKEFFLAKMISPDLAFRSSADEFFDSIESIKVENIVVDFKGIRSISRSFAQEYLDRKKKSRKITTEKNVPVLVKKMFEVVRQTQEKTKIIDLKSVEVITV